MKITATQFAGVKWVTSLFRNRGGLAKCCDASCGKLLKLLGYSNRKSHLGTGSQQRLND